MSETTSTPTSAKPNIDATVASPSKAEAGKRSSSLVDSAVSEKPPKIKVKILSNEKFSVDRLDNTTLHDEQGVINNTDVEKQEPNPDAKEIHKYGNTNTVIWLLSEMWIIHSCISMAAIFGY